MAKYSTLILLILGATTTHLSGQTPFIQTDRPEKVNPHLLFQQVVFKVKTDFYGKDKVQQVKR